MDNDIRPSHRIFRADNPSRQIWLVPERRGIRQLHMIMDGTPNGNPCCVGLGAELRRRDLLREIRRAVDAGCEVVREF